MVGPKVVGFSWIFILSKPKPLGNGNMWPGMGAVLEIPEKSTRRDSPSRCVLFKFRSRWYKMGV